MMPRSHGTKRGFILSSGRCQSPDCQLQDAWTAAPATVLWQRRSLFPDFVVSTGFVLESKSSEDGRDFGHCQ